ncbi:scaffolding protein [Bacillus cereus]|uniref:Scaffolding protein n=1 Tax=Bacillus cereus TaxID=1396 RepID=A0A9X7GX81_BACCE|nr:scaffolding protein [Bacillus cereus]PGS81639.1 scaffolding protein [Bacillus cereus]
MWEFIKEILAKHTDAETGKIDIEAVMKAINEESPKHAVPKEQYNKQADQLKQLTEDLKSAQDSTATSEELQQKLDEAVQKAEAAETARLDLEKSTALKDLLTQKGAKDPEYAAYKLGELEYKDGKFTDFDNKFKDFEKSYPDQFKEAEPDDKLKDGFKPLDNGLKGGQPQTTYTMDDIGSMTADEINSNWDAIAASNGGN